MPTIGSGHPAVFSHSRLYGHALLQRRQGIVWYSTRSPRLARHRSSCQQVCGHHAARHPHFLECLHAPLTPEEFGSLRFVMAGAEKLPDRISQGLRRSFRHPATRRLRLHRMLSRYTVNTIDFRAASFRQVELSAAALATRCRNDGEDGGPRSCNRRRWTSRACCLVRGPNVMPSPGGGGGPSFFFGNRGSTCPVI